VSSTLIAITLNKASNEASHPRPSDRTGGSSYDNLSPVYFPPDSHQASPFSSAMTSNTGAARDQIKSSNIPSYKTQALLLASPSPTINTSHPNKASSTSSQLHINNAGSHNQNHYAATHLGSTFTSTYSTRNTPDDTFEISSDSSTQNNILCLGQKEDAVQLQNWLCETSNTNITFAERLEKVKRETKRIEKL
jgi:hypothetical protein